MICSAYQKVDDTKGYCIGIKEPAYCNCKGDESQCEYYPEKRNTNFSNVSALEFLKAKKNLCDIKRDCRGCPIQDSMALKELDSTFCDEYFLIEPEECIRLVMQWWTDYNKPIIWNQWLHYLYDYYNGLNQKKNFLEWLNTPIPQDAKEKYNIPDRL